MAVAQQPAMCAVDVRIPKDVTTTVYLGQPDPVTHDAVEQVRLYLDSGFLAGLRDQFVCQLDQRPV